MRRYRLRNGRVRPAQPGVRLERQLIAAGGVLVEDDDPAALAGIPAADLAAMAALDREDRWALTDLARLGAPGVPAPLPGPLDMEDPAEVVALVEDFDFDTLEQLIRDETSGRNRDQVLAGLQRLRDNAKKPGKDPKTT